MSSPSVLDAIGLSEVTRRLLSPDAGAIEPPVRAVMFGAARFAEHGRSLAQAQAAALAPGGRLRETFFPRLEDNLTTLRDARELLEEHSGQGHHLTPAAGWLIDNGALIEQQFETVRNDLPRSYYRKLPRLRVAPLAGLPRVYGLAWAWVAHTDSGLDESLLQGYLAAYQRECELTLAELWAIPTTLRVVLVENLRRLAERAATHQAARDAAHRWIERAAQRQEPGRVDAGLLEALGELLERRGMLQPFALELQRRADELGGDARAELAGWLARHLPDPAAALQAQQQHAAEDHQSVRNAITTLRGLARVDWRGLFMHSSATMHALCTLPVFTAEAERTQDLALHAIERIARITGQAESAVAGAVVRLAAPAAGRESAPLHWLRGAGRAALWQALGRRRLPLADRVADAARRAAPTTYVGGVVLVTAAMVVGLLHRELSPDRPAWGLLLAALLLAAPVSEAVVATLNRLISESLPPAPLPRLALKDGIPAEHRPLVVIPSLLTDAGGAAALCAQLELHHLANPEPHAQYALLTDGADASARVLPGDAALLAAAREGIEQLNRRHPAPPGAPLRFLLLHRERVWSDSEQAWIGWERKRGKLEQLAGWLAALGPSHVDTAPSPFVDLGALSRPAAGVRSIVTLDSDTEMPPGRLRALVAIAAHPLNAPCVDTLQRRVVQGYGILQPRVAAPLPSAGQATPFHRLFSGRLGIDPYSAASSEIYQDLFGEGSFSGKGLLDVAAMNATLSRRLPESRVLSHDLFEGAIARCAMASDVTLLEDVPADPDLAAMRLHRWTRGDWQLLPFVARPEDWPMAPISRWKMLDNLRRSLVAPLSLALVVWSLAGGPMPVSAALAVVLAAWGAGPLLGALAGLAPRRDDVALPLFFRHAAAELLRAAGGALWHLAHLLPHALLMGDAIVRALVRQFVTHRRLLEWTTAAAAARQVARSGLLARCRRHAGASAAAIGLFAVLALWDRFGPGLGTHGGAAAGAPVALGWAFVLCAAWAAVPLWAWLGSRPLPERTQRLDPGAQAEVLKIARDTWRYYERHVADEDNHLPPDNVQTMPGAEPGFMVAHRTSPTNIGLYLLAAASARELGFIDRGELAERFERTLATLERLPRERGHFLNWYDTRTLAVLAPAYVSAVDSGNLSGHLLIAAAACDAAAAEAETGPPARPGQRAARRAGHAAALHDASAPQAAATPQAADTPPDGSGALPARLRHVAERCRTLALAADFSLLYDPRRRLMHIGWRVDGAQLDDSHYDLLASESRLGSLVAIAKGDVPPEHWAALGRPWFAGASGAGLKSWSGSMFEYLMPSLVLDEPPGSVLRQAARCAVDEQRAEARGSGTPWGISESAIAVQDHTRAWQYGPHGVASLALARVPPGERVIAPYASTMALVVAPRAALANLRALAALGARRAFGFIEALDYTPQRQPAEPIATAPGFVAVDTFMAHHQAMSLLACTQVLTGGALQRWSAAVPWLRAVRALLHEPVPHEAPPLRRLPAAAAPPLLQRTRWQLDDTPLRGGLPPTHLFGNGRHVVALRSNGAGFSQYQGVALSRWRDDLPRDAHGLFGYLRFSGRDAERDDWVSLTARPAPDPEADYRCEMHPDRAVFHAEWPQLQATTTAWVATDDDCEMRRIVLRNTGRRPRTLTLALAFEATLAPLAADEAHPAFSNLFVHARWHAGERALYLQRKPRLPDEPSMHAVLFLASRDGRDSRFERIEACADRAAWIGRLGSSAAPDGVFAKRRPGPAPVHSGSGDLRELPTGLDPAAVILVHLSVPAGGVRTLHFGLGAARDEDTLRTMVDRYRHPAWTQRSSELSDTLARIRLRELRLDPETWAAGLRLNTRLLGTVPRGMPEWSPQADALRPQASAGDEETSGVRAFPHDAMLVDRRLLWRFAVSGDRPIVAVRVEGPDGIALVQQLARLLPPWSAAGFGVDVVVVNAEAASYQAPVQQALVALTELLNTQIDPALPAARRAALHVLQARDLSAPEAAALQALARVSLRADGRSLAQHVERLRQPLSDGTAATSQAPRPSVRVLAPERPDATALPPSGRFDGPDAADAGYRVVLSASRYPPRPWINVLANPDFGTQVSDAAAGFTWAGNSRMHQVTPWSNDPLCDPAGEALLLEDLDSRRAWVLGRGLGSTGRELHHAPGQTRMRERVDGIEIELTWCVDAQAAVKQVTVALRAPPGAVRRLRLVAYAEWALGAGRAERATVHTQPYRWLGTPADIERGQRVGFALHATQLDAGPDGGGAGATGFLCWRPCGASGPAPGSVSPDVDDWTCDRAEFFDRAGRWVLPARLLGRSGGGLDPCAALGCRLDLGPGGSVRLALLLGHADSAEAARKLTRRACAVDPVERLREQAAAWDERLGTLGVATPDPAFDALVNRWLPYQTIACRLWARAGFYQAGGAFGFRDQLQDAMSLALRAPAMLRRQILVHAARQFVEGDVQHWWHLPSGAGVRTHISDDLLWLPFAVAHYLRASGDAAVLDEPVPFLAGGEIPPGREDLYEVPQVAPEPASLHEHAARAIDHALRTGVHGLPLIGTGDWNDGMNRVGHHGAGESVWLGWFLCQVIEVYAPWAERRGEAARAGRWRAARAALVQALEREGWDGHWYRRAFFDDGSPLGSQANTECRIDLIAQCWAVLSGAGDSARAALAMASADARLWDADAGVMRLLDPPLQHARPSAGYIQAYPPGIRENGGQYSHAATWALMAWARLGDAPRAWRMFEALSPAHRSADPRRGPRYGLEPYVVAGDIGGAAPYAGRGGWSWYTGAAGWLASAAVESLLGLEVAGGVATLRPCLPPHWPHAQLRLRHEGRTHRFSVCRDAAAAAALRERHPQAQRLRRGEPVALATLADGSHHIVGFEPAPPPSGNAACSADALHTQERFR